MVISLLPIDSSIMIVKSYCLLSNVYPIQSDVGIPASLRGLHSGLNRSQQSLTSDGSQETETKTAKVLYDYSVRIKLILTLRGRAKVSKSG